MQPSSHSSTNFNEKKEAELENENENKGNETHVINQDINAENNEKNQQILGDENENNALHFNQQLFNTDNLQVELQTTSIIFPWSKQLIQQINFIELDASFKGLKPYVYCVENVIIHNESVPLSITIIYYSTISLLV